MTYGIAKSLLLDMNISTNYTMHLIKMLGN